jgi:hypothetical protein
MPHELRKRGIGRRVLGRCATTTPYLTAGQLRGPAVRHAVYGGTPLSWLGFAARGASVCLEKAAARAQRGVSDLG